MLDQLTRDILAAPPGQFFGALSAAAVVSAGLVWFGLSRLKRLQLIANTPTSRIRSAAQGYLELKGTARALEGPPVIAPLTLTPCTWYSYRVQRRSSGNNGRNSWRTIESGTSDALFAIDDETGRCVIDPEGASVIPSFSENWHGRSRHGGRGRRHGVMFGFGQHYRFQERRIVDGDPLFALGHFSTHRAADAMNRREEIASVLRAWKADRTALLERFDADGDGEIDLEEWDKARAAAETEVDARHREAAVAEGFHILARPAARRLPFLIAARDEQTLIAHHRWALFGAGIPGAVLAGLALWALFARLGGASL